ncbi:peptidase [Streptosporangium sp. NPDC051023]|uniref:trypsin-like serine peptidase n=1 Tax=Streptosporangium sp. NPDC051023 TaxID=3155410 RepID=UPI00344D7EDA
MRRTACLVPILTLAAGSTLLSATAAHSATAASATPPASTVSATVSATDTEPVEKEAADTGAEQRSVRRYWTEAKMAAAKPLDAVAPGKGGVRLTAAAAGTRASETRLSGARLSGTQASGMRLSGTRASGAQPSAAPVSVPATSPGGEAATTVKAPAASRASTGAPWTRSGAIVKTVGRVFFTYQGRNASCSGNAVTSGNKSTVITAGHCVRMGGAFHTNWVFVPGYDNGDRPYGTWVATTLYTTPQWNNSEDVDYDVAAAVVAPLNSRSLTDVVGGQGVSFNQARRQQMHSFGYPAAYPYDGSKLVYCSGRTFDDFMMSHDIGLDCDMTGGSSGGPWFSRFDERTGLGTLNSVNSFKYGSAGGWMFGPYFGTDAQAVYDAAQDTGAP